MATFNVINSNDSGAGSLRKAVSLANANPGKDDIYVQTDVTLNSAIKITDSVTIGTPHGATIIQTQSDRIFTIDDGEESASEVILHRLNLTGGNPDSIGGAILSYENLRIVDSELYENATADRGGAVYVEGANLSVERTKIYDNQINLVEGAPSAGGGIYVLDGNLDLLNSVVENNESAISSIIISNGIAEVLNTQIINNLGGGIAAGGEGELKVIDSYVDGNNSISIESETFDGVGGGISFVQSSTGTIDNTIVSNNSGNFGGGVEVDYYSTAEIVDSTITGNTATQAGGGVHAQYYANLMIEDTDIFDNSAEYYGGGIGIVTESTVTITDSTITGNIAGETGGGIDVYDNSALEVSQSIISGNTANFGGGVASYDGTSDIVLTNISFNNNVPNNVAGEGIDLLITGDNLDNIIEGDNGNDTLKGGVGNDTLQGGAGDDEMDGGIGNDQLKGNGGDDTLMGGQNFDNLDGGDGDDVLIGDRGIDIMTGGAGQDLFYLEAVEGLDWIRDFQLGTDKLGLADGITFSQLEITGKVNSFVSDGGKEVAVILNVKPQDLAAVSFQEV